MTATTHTSTTPPAPPPTLNRAWFTPSGDRLYLLGRVLMLVVFGVVLALTETDNLFALPSLTSDLSVLLVWAFAGFTLLSLLLLLPALQRVLSATSFVDIGAISVLLALNPAQHNLLFALYVLPVIYLGLRYRKDLGIVSGVGAAFCYVGAFLVGQYIVAEAPTALQTAAYASLGIQALLLAFLPWLAYQMADQWSAVNRMHVQAAQDDVALAKQETEAYQQQMVLLFQMAARLQENLSGPRVLDSLLSEANSLIPYDTGLALLPTSQSSELRVEAGYGLNMIDEGATFSVSYGNTLAQAFGPSAEPLTLAQIAQDDAFASIESLRTRQAACLLPLRSGVQVFGVVVLARASAEPFGDDELALLEALTSYATVALLNADMDIEIKRERMDMLTAQEYARHWLAREIHDNLAQKLAAITMNIDLIRRLIDMDPEQAKSELETINDLYRRANYDVRTLLGELKPTTLETKGLPSAIEEYIDRLRKAHKQVELLFEKKGISGLTLSKEARSTLFNIVQEALNNALRYAEPQRVRVFMSRSGYQLTIRIEDDGKGFDVEESKKKARARGSYGLSNLNDRARLIGGVTEIHSEIGKGACVTVTVPLEV